MFSDLNSYFILSISSLVALYFLQPSIADHENTS